jgi:hypothetical protein
MTVCGDAPRPSLCPSSAWCTATARGAVDELVPVKMLKVIAVTPGLR